jgi:hypothetical protein
MRDEHHTEHLLGDLFRFFRRLGKLNAAAFPAPTGMDLRLYDNDVRAKFACGRFGLVRCACDYAARHRNSIIL